LLLNASHKKDGELFLLILFNAICSAAFALYFGNLIGFAGHWVDETVDYVMVGRRSEPQKGYYSLRIDNGSLFCHLQGHLLFVITPYEQAIFLLWINVSFVCGLCRQREAC
jgi:hypothetical protein